MCVYNRDNLELSIAHTPLHKEWSNMITTSCRMECKYNEK